MNTSLLNAHDPILFLEDGVKIPFHKLELSNDPQTLGDFFGDLARTATKENPFWTTIPLASSQEPLWLNTPSSSCLNGGGAEEEEEAKQEGVMNELKAEEQFWYYNDEGGPARFSPDCSAIVFTASNMVSSPPPPSRNSSSSAAVAVTELVVMEPSVSLRSSGKLPAWAWDWATRRNTTLNSYSAAAAELTTRLVTQLGRQSRGPVWMPDGQRVLFSSSSNHSQPALLYMVTVEDEERRHDEFDESSSSNTTINNCAANNTVQEVVLV